MAPAAEPHRIRRARPEDLEALKTIEDDAFEPARRVSTDSLRRSLRSPSQRVDIVEADGQVVAFAVTWPRARTWRIYDLAVRPGHQGRGLGRALLDAVEEAARAAGAERIVLEADAKRPDLVQFYERRGYRAVRTLQGFYGPGLDAIRVAKMLPGRPEHGS